MGKRQKEWARQARFRLQFLLGGQCRKCGSVETLCFDCIEPRGDFHHRLDTSARMSFYHREHKAGNLQLLCAECNGIKSLQEQETVPF
jgi:hypothetical protein